MSPMELDEEGGTLWQAQLAILVACRHLNLEDMAVKVPSVENLIQQFNPGDGNCSLQSCNDGVDGVLQAMGEKF